MYIVSGARTPFCLLDTHLHLLKTHNLGATAIRALMGMVSGVEHMAVQKTYVGLSRDLGGSVDKMMQHSGLDGRVATHVHGRGAGLMALYRMIKAPRPSGVGFVVGIEGGLGGELPVFGDGYSIAVDDERYHLLGADLEALQEYTGFDVDHKSWNMWWERSQDCGKQAEKSDVLLHEIAPISLSVEGETKHIARDDCLVVKPRYSEVNGALDMRYMAPICDGATALCVSHHELPHTLARVEEVLYVEPHECGCLHAAVACIRGLLDKCDLDAKDIQIVEIDESIIWTPAVCARETGIDLMCVNRWGGTCALGDAGAASDLRMILAAAHGMTLLDQQWSLVLCPVSGGGAVGILLGKV